MAKVKATMPDFQTEPNFGDPFTSDDIKEFAASLEEADTENEEDADEAAKEELEQVQPQSNYSSNKIITNQITIWRP